MQSRRAGGLYNTPKQKSTKGSMKCGSCMICLRDNDACALRTHERRAARAHRRPAQTSALHRHQLSIHYLSYSF